MLTDEAIDQVETIVKYRGVELIKKGDSLGIEFDATPRPRNEVKGQYLGYILSKGKVPKKHQKMILLFLWSPEEFATIEGWLQRSLERSNPT